MDTAVYIFICNNFYRPRGNTFLIFLKFRGRSYSPSTPLATPLTSGPTLFPNRFSTWTLFSIDIFCSGHRLRPYRMPGSAVNDRHRNPRSLRRWERHVVASVWKRRTAKIRADIDHFVSQLDVRSRCVRPEAGDGFGIRKHFSERKTRFVSCCSLCFIFCMHWSISIRVVALVARETFIFFFFTSQTIQRNNYCGHINNVLFLRVFRLTIFLWNRRG